METDGDIQAMDWMVCYSNSGDISILDFLKEKKAQSESTGIYDVFVPLDVQRIVIDGQAIERNRFIAGNYIFLKATNDDIMRLREEPPFDATLRFLHPAGDPLGTILIKDDEIQMMCKTVERIGSEVEYFVPSSKELLIADLVCVINGLYAGVKGFLESVKGHEGGKVIVALGNVLAVRTPKIPVEDIQLLQLATVPDSPSGSYTSRAYKKVHTFAEDSRRLLEEKEENGTLSAEKETEARRLITRFSQLQLNGKIRFMHAQAICDLYMALGETDSEEYQRFKNMLP